MSAVPYLSDPDFVLHQGDALEVLRSLPAESVDCCVLAYIAGLIDGEAYIGIKKSGRTYHERIQVRMVDEGAIRFLTLHLGGNYYREKPHANNGRPLYCWQASDKRAAAIGYALLPYLIVSCGMSLALGQRLYEYGRLLNKTGGDAKYGAVPA